MKINASGACAALAGAALVLACGCEPKTAAPPAGPDGVKTSDAPAAEPVAGAAEEPAGKDAAAEEDAPVAPDARGYVPIPIKLPKPAFIGTPKQIPPGTTVQKSTGKPRPPFMAPQGTKNVAFEKPVASSDEEPIIGDPEQVTDGDKEAGDGSYVEFGPGTQHVTVDLERVCELYAVVIWHYHGDPRIYHDVIVQVADDADFITGVQTIFNNDHDNSSGLGLGKEYEYFETREGLLVEAKGVKTRYLRAYSNGSTVDEMNRYAEVEVYGKPVE